MTIHLTDMQRLYLQRIFDLFRERSQWPTYREVDRWFTYYHADVDIEDIWKSLPLGLTSYMDLQRPESQATLTVPAICVLDNNLHVVRPFLELLKVCVDVYMHSSAEKPEICISSEGILEAYPLWWEIGVRQSGFLLKEEPNIWSSFSGPDQTGHWQCTLARGVRRFRGVTTIEEYLEKRDPPRTIASSPSTGSAPDTSVLISAQNVRLHPTIHAKCWSLYTQGDHDSAILNATKAIEVAVRKKAQLADEVVGVDVVNLAFSLKNPVLHYSQVDAEQQGMMSLLRGMIQVYKNPQSHRFVGVQNASDCLGVLLMCSSLLSIVDALEEMRKP